MGRLQRGSAEGDICGSRGTKDREKILEIGKFFHRIDDGIFVQFRFSARRGVDSIRCRMSK